MVGRLAAALTPKPTIGPESQTTAAWKHGATGELRVAEILDGLKGISALHDRRIPRSKANIRMSGVTALWPKALAELVGKTGPLDKTAIDETTKLLAAALKPA